MIASYPMDCPRCGLAAGEQSSCPRCGVVFSKIRSPREPRVGPVAPEARPASGYASLIAPTVFVALSIGSGLWFTLRRPPQTEPAKRAASSSRSEPAAAEPAAPPRLTPPTLAPLPPPPKVDPDAQAAQALVARINAGSHADAADVQVAEGLYARHVGEEYYQRLLTGVLLALGNEEHRARRYAEAGAHLRRAADLDRTSAAPRLALMATLLDSADWPGGEAAAREALALDATNTDALSGLAFALYRQDKNRDAADTLKTLLAIHDSAEARSLLQRITKGLADERGMTEQRISHFNVRYDGEAHEDVGREILSALERHFATLTGLLDHEPQATIPVILFSSEGYYNASGAPAWSGGAYDPMDGRIRIPIGGLTASLTPDMDATLIHELTHAFVADGSRGLAPREIHEGLAQYMEGKRIASLLNADQMRLLADGRASGVMGFYLQALSLVEYLEAQRGQGGMNDLIKAMGETGDVNEAFRRTYGEDWNGTRRAWTQRMQQQYGS
jgi:hypothetical protein